MVNTLQHLCYLLKVEEKELINIIKNIDSFYYEKIELKTEKDGTPKLDKHGKQKKRIIHPSIKRLKVIQKRVQANILLSLELPDYAFGAVKKRDNIKNARKHQGKKFIFTTDLKDFFPSIRHNQVFEMFRLYGFSPTVARVLTQLTTYKGKVPQGAPTSATIANLVFVKTGKKLNVFAQQLGLTFTSFIDDLTFSAPANFKDEVQFIITTIQEDGFKVSHKKTNYKTKKPMVTGIVVKNNNLALPNTFRIKLQNTAGKTVEQINGMARYAERVKKA